MAPRAALPGRTRGLAHLEDNTGQAHRAWWPSAQAGTPGETTRGRSRDGGHPPAPRADRDSERPRRRGSSVPKNRRGGQERRKRAFVAL